ncbi:MAG: mechanosensitive ion channel [Clostridia bacterium]|nr:mechanosensitive ion channel [Clostridia bacterium]
MFDTILGYIEDIWSIGFVRFIVYLLLAFLAAGIASWLVTKLLKLTKLDKKFDKWGINEGVLGTSMKFVGKLVYLIVFLLFLPNALEAIGVTTVSGPINGFVSTFINYLPNIIAAVILVYVGVLVAQILGQIVSVLLKKTKIDSLVKRTDSEEKKTVLLSDVLVKIMMGVIILVTIVSALCVLEIEAISAPAIGIVNSIFGAIPSIILAVVVVTVGIFVANLACGLLYNVLIAANFDSVVTKILPQLKISATKIVVNTVRTIIIIFVAAQGIEALNLSILTMIVTAVVSYLPLVIKAAVILLVAFIGANMLEAIIVKANPKAANLAKIVKVGIFTLAGFMILSQLEIASTIVNTAFIVTISAIAISFALAFGLGGKDFAKKTLDRVDDKIESNLSKEEKNEEEK